MIELLKQFLITLKSHLLPNVCGICEQLSDDHRDLCQCCFGQLPWLQDKPGWLLGDRIYSVFSYQEPIIGLVKKLKFNEQLWCARLLGDLLAEHLCIAYQDEPLPQIVVPMPLHKKRLKQRGFNQSIEIATVIAKKNMITMANKIASRIKKTPPQASLCASRRKRNLQGAFCINHPIAYQHIAIVDDVVTTGSTANALSQVFKKQGVQRVDIWCICRA